MLKLLMEHVDRKMPQDHPQKANTTKLAKLELQEYDRCIFRAQPRHRECANGKPWMWAIMHQECMTREMRAEFENLFPEGSTFCSAAHAGRTTGEMDHAVEATTISTE